MAQETKTVEFDKFGGKDSKDFSVTSNKNETFTVEDKDGNEVAKYDAIRSEVKQCKFTLAAEGAPYKIKFQDNEAAAVSEDNDDVSGAEAI